MKKYGLLIFLFLFHLMFAVSCKSSSKQSLRAYPVTIGEVKKKDVVVYIESIGNVYSLQNVLIRPQVGGIVVEAYVKQGQYVKKGDPLYKIDPRPFQAALERAEATLAKNEATLKYSEEQLERNKELVSKDYVSKLNYEQFVSQVNFNKAQLQSDKAEVALAELNLEWTIPRAPMDGKISQYNIDPGNLVTANDPTALTDIRQITPADIRFGINQTDFVKVQQAKQNGSLKFEVMLPQDSTHPRLGNIYFIDNHLNQATGTILLRGTVQNEDEMFWPGEFVRVRLHLGTIKDALVVPEQAIKLGQEGAYLYVYHPETSTVEYRSVVKGETLNHLVVILEGIEAGEKVVLQGQNNLLPGAKVFISTQDSEAGVN